MRTNPAARFSSVSAQLKSYMRAGSRQGNGPGQAAGGYLRKIGGGIGGGLENLRDLVTGYNTQGFMVSAM